MADRLRAVIVGGPADAAQRAIEALRQTGAIVELRTASDLAEATELLATFPPDVVVDATGRPAPAASEPPLSLPGGQDQSGLYRDIIEYSRDLFYVHGADHVLTYVSPQSRQFFDCEPEEALVRWTEFATDNPVNRIGLQLTQRAIDSGEPQPAYELELVARSGRRFWVEVREEPVVREGRTVAIVGALTDITERKRTEERLALLGHALRSVGEGVCMTDRTDTIRFVNEAFCRLYGYTEAELVGRPVAMLRADDVPAELEQAIRRDTLGVGWHGEIWHVRKDGTRILVSLATSTVCDERGAPLALIEVVRDVTEQRRTEDALRESEDRYRDLVENSDDLICTHDLRGVFLTVNRAAARAVGYTAAELVGHNISELLSPRGREELPAYLETVRGLGAASGIMELTTKHGDTRYWEYENTVRTEGVTEPVVRGHARDVTEKLRAQHSLRMSEQRFRALFEGANDGVLILHGSRIAECNPMACELYGRSEDELVGARPWQLSPPVQPDGQDSRTKAQALIAAALAGEPQRFEWEHTRGDGSLFFVEVSLSALPIGNEVVVQALVRDRTRQRLAEQAERRRLRQLATVNRIAHQVATELDLDAVVRAAVREIHEAFGYHSVSLLLVDSVARQLGRQSIAGAYEEIAQVDVRQKVGEGLIGTAAATGQTVVSNDVRSDPRYLLGHDIEVATRAEVAVPIRLGDEVIAVLDVHEARPNAFDESDVQVLETLASELAASLNNARLYAALKESEERYRTFFEQDLTADVLASTDGVISDANPAFAAIFGFESPAEARATPLRDLFARVADWTMMLDRLRRQRHLSYVELELRRRDGEPVHVVANCVGIFDAAGELVGVRSYLFDITAYKATEEQLRQAQKMEAIGRLAGGVAHDFNNVLQAMLATVHVLRLRAEEMPERATQLAELEDNVQRGAALTRQLLLFARREVSAREDLDLARVIGDSAPMLRRLIRENIRMVVELGSDPIPVRGDEGQLQQVLMNLVVNAVDAMPDGGVLTVAAGRTGDEVWWQVTDSGVGMSEEVRRRLFEPFFTTKGLGKGTGLGLAVAHGIIASHGGRILVSSVPGGGASFRITLPAGSSAVGGPDGRTQPGVPTRGNGERILVVEDEPTAREGLREILTLLDYQVDAVDSAEAALEVAASVPYDVLLTDYVLPGRNGLELAARLRQLWPRLEVILMSGYAEDTTLRDGSFADGVRYLQKPFDIAALARTLRAMLGEP